MTSHVAFPPEVCENCQVQNDLNCIGNMTMGCDVVIPPCSKFVTHARQRNILQCISRIAQTHIHTVDLRSDYASDIIQVICIFIIFFYQQKKNLGRVFDPCVFGREINFIYREWCDLREEKSPRKIVGLFPADRGYEWDRHTQKKHESARCNWTRP